MPCFAFPFFKSFVSKKNTPYFINKYSEEERGGGENTRKTVKMNQNERGGVHFYGFTGTYIQLGIFDSSRYIHALHIYVNQLWGF